MYVSKIVFFDMFTSTISNREKAEANQMGGNPANPLITIRKS